MDVTAGLLLSHVAEVSWSLRAQGGTSKQQHAK